MTPTAPLTDQEYVDAGGNSCPICRSREIEGHHIEVDGTTAWQPVDCNNCGASWNDIYQLTGYNELEEG